MAFQPTFNFLYLSGVSFIIKSYISTLGTNDATLATRKN